MKMKFSYVKPIVTVTIIEIEYALASGSARASAENSSFQIFEEWEQEENVKKTIDW